MGDEIARIENHPVFGFLCVSYETMIGPDWDQELACNLLPVYPKPGDEAFYDIPHLYPVTIVQARYGGTYEGASWLAFPCYPSQLNDLCPSWNDSDIECAEFWHTARTNPERWPIGGGTTADGAYNDLIDRVTQIAQRDSA